MSLIETITSTTLAARRARDSKKSALLSTLLSDVQLVGKNNGNRQTTDAEATAVIKKFISNAKETCSIAPSADVQNEIAILESLLPHQLSRENLVCIVADLIAETGAASVRDLGKVMKLLKERHEGQYDGAEASRLIKEHLTNQA